MFVLLALAGTQVVRAAAISQFLEHKLDERKWLPMRGQTFPNILQFGYYLEGETPQNATETVTFQVFIGEQENFSAEEFVTKTRDAMIKQIGDSVEWNPIRESEEDMLYEFRVRGNPRIPDVYQLQRVVQGRDAIHVMAYSNDHADLAGDERQKWIDILEASKLVDRSAEGEEEFTSSAEVS